MAVFQPVVRRVWFIDLTEHLTKIVLSTVVDENTNPDLARAFAHAR